MTIAPNIDAEFAALIPPLMPDELAKLEVSIVAAGRATDALKTWRGTLLDGHNRLAICARRELPFACEDVAGIETRDDALIWIERNQLGRRNLTDDQRTAITHRLLRREVARSKAERASLGGTSGGKSRPKDNSLVAHASTKLSGKKQRKRTEVAKAANVSEKKLRAIDEIAKSDPGAVDRVARGETTIIKERAELNKKARAELASKPVALPTGQYHCIVIDPPWPMEKIERDVRPNQVGFDYPPMDEAQLGTMTLPAADDCHLFCWTTHKFLPMALRLLEAWDFRYVCTFVWHKAGGYQPIGLPQYNCEFALYARRGSPKFVELTDFKVCFEAPRREHSRKPDEFYNLVQRVTAEPRTDMFAREKRPGFVPWGNETDKFPEVA